MENEKEEEKSADIENKCLEDKSDFSSIKNTKKCSTEN